MEPKNTNHETGSTFAATPLLACVERLKIDAKVCRSTSEAVHYYGTEKDRLGEDISLALEEIERLRVFEQRLKWLHSGGEKDADGCEWGVFRVKWNPIGQPAEVWQTFSDMSDLDEAMREQPNT